MTIGEIRVRTSFNVTNSSEVDIVKTTTAQLINTIAQVGINESNYTTQVVAEFNRLKALANTSYEEAAMWAVKTLTFENYVIELSKLEKQNTEPEKQEG